MSPGTDYVLRSLTATGFGAFRGDDTMASFEFVLEQRVVRWRNARRRVATPVVARVRTDAPAALAVLLKRGFVIVDMGPNGMLGLARNCMEDGTAIAPQHRSALLVALGDARAQADALAYGLVGREVIRHGQATYVLFGEADGLS